MKNKLVPSKTMSRRDMLKLMGLGTAAAVVAGCSPKATASPTPVPPTAVPPTEPPKEVTLRYQNHWTKETDAHYKGMNWLYEEFGKAYPYIHIENILNPDSTESFKKIMADCAAGDCPEIIHEGSADMWKSGYLLDLAPYLDADPAWKKLFIPSTFFVDGASTYGLCAEFSPMPVIWNTRILEAAGVSDLPKTWDEFMTVCDKVKTFGKLPTSWEVGGSHQWHDIIASQAGGLDAIAANKFDSPQMREAFTRLKTFVDNKWLPENELEITWQQSIAFFVAEETAFYLDGAWTIQNNIYSEGAAPDLRDFVKYAPYPAVSDNGSTVELKVGTPLSLSAELQNDQDMLDGAITFFKFWFSEEGAKQWILLCQSPMGIYVDLSTLEGVDPGLLGHLGAQDSAQTVYTLPSTPAVVERGWDDCQSGLDTLLSGGSVDDAMAAYLNEMSKYA